MFARPYTLLLVVVVVSASWAAFGAAGAAGVSAILLALAMHLHARTGAWRWSLRLAAVPLWLFAIVSLLAPVINAARSAAQNAHCMNNLKQIATALRNYREVNGSYPPVCTYDKAGRPMHSWRLLILPFLDCSATYKECNLNEPWDSPSNAKFRADRKYIYKCPADPTAYARDSNTTSYVALVGGEAGWRRGRNGRAEDDGPREKGAKTGNDTFLVIEKTNSGIQWAEPRDIRLDDLQALQSLATNGPHVRDNGYFFQKTQEANAVLLIGDMTFFFPSDSSTGVIAGLLPPREERSGTEHGPKYIPPQYYVEEIAVNWRHRIGLPVWLVAIGLLVHRMRRRQRGLDGTA